MVQCSLLSFEGKWQKKELAGTWQVFGIENRREVREVISN
jgi:hypothetical protein